MAMKTLTHLCETVLLIEWRHPRCQCSKILSTHYFQMAHCGPTPEPNKNLIKPTWWRTFDDDEKVSFVVVLFQISFQVRVHSPNSCTEMFLNSLHVELWFLGPDSKVSCHFHYAFLDLCLLQHFAVLLQIHSDQVKQVILMFHLWKRLVKSSTAS